MGRALVLSGGGSVGIAWQTGLTAGLLAGGVDLRAADAVIGTSAGSAVGAQIALGRDLTDSLERYRKAPRRSNGPRDASRDGAATASGLSTAERMEKLMSVMAGTMTSGGSPEEVRAAIGRFALDAETVPEERFVAGFSYLAGERWPAGYRCTAVDAETGSFQVWDDAAGAPLDRAVASSCAVPGLFPPITIGGRRYIDGGMRSGSNADLAAGHELVFLVTLMSDARAAVAPDDRRLAQARDRLQRERAAIEEAGGRLELIGPDAVAAEAIGGNLMDAANTTAAAEAGFAQGRAAADAVAAIWS